MMNISGSRIIALFMALLVLENISAQQNNCAFKAPVIKIDFGAGNIQDINSNNLPKYQRDYGTCPADGFYAFVANTTECFNGDWLTIQKDHTGEGNGNMMLVNASETGGTFFSTNMYGFPKNTLFQLTVWMMNVCRINGGCQPLPPNIVITITTKDGRKIGLFKTGVLSQGNVPLWRKFTGFFQTPADVTAFTLTMADKTLGGCGNDFAMDDLTISECITTGPLQQNEPAVRLGKPEKQLPTLVKQTPVANAPGIKGGHPKINQVKNDSVAVATKPMPVNQATTTIMNDRPVVSVPEALISRTNPLAKEISTSTGEIVIDLYDNGEIDGDTVSVYHNNELIVSKAGLSDKPISFHLRVDKMQPHHELIMVANNLGSIPPNTSTMIITTDNKRYEIFISSTEQKNAKVVIDLKE